MNFGVSTKMALTKRFSILVVIFALSGCASSVELAANLHKACYLRTIDGCPTDRIEEWFSGN